MKQFKFLLPGRLRLPGMIFIVLGFCLGIVRFWYGIKPDFLNFKVFAIYSSYLQSKFLEVVKNQMSEEITGILVITGLFLVAFAKEKEENERLDALRLNSFFISFYLNTIFLLAALIFTFGIGFIYMMMISLVSWLSIYIISFRILAYKDHLKNKNFNL
jgi:hypothetical protein